MPAISLLSNFYLKGGAILLTNTTRAIGGKGDWRVADMDFLQTIDKANYLLKEPSQRLWVEFRGRVGFQPVFLQISICPRKYKVPSRFRSFDLVGK